MSLVNIQNWLLRAQRDRFAIGAFNVNTLEQAQAIVTAAEAEAAPALLQVSHRALEYIGQGNCALGLRYIAQIGQVAAQSVTVPISLHLDHGTADEVLQAFALGFTSVMFDGGDLPLEENIVRTRELCRRAHGLGVCFEGEVGETPKPDSASAAERAGEFTEPPQAEAYVQATGIDNLAVSIGSSHGGKRKTVTLDLERLTAIRAVVAAPLVLHGSSGVTDASISASIALGIVKVNVATLLNQAFTDRVRAGLTEREVVDPRKYLGPARRAVFERVRERIRFLGASGKA